MYLNCKTQFSFRYGTYKTEDLVLAAKAQGIKALALTNINNTADIWDFVQFCEAQDIKPIAGIEIRNDDTLLYLLLARNNQGLLAMNRFLSRHLQAGIPFPARPPQDEDYWVIYPLGAIDPGVLQLHEKIGVRAAELNKLYRYRDHAYADKFVMRQPVTFENQTGYNIHRLLQAVDKNILLSRQDRNTLAAPDETFGSPDALLQAFAAYPGIILQTRIVTDSCSIGMDFRKDKTKSSFKGSAEADRAYLRQLAFDGMQQRYGSDHKEAQARIEKELQIIDSQGFNAYFLITYDVIRYARHRGFYHVGRGSGANSIVAYCLQITDVDPIELDLYFERFLNPERATPPDFDIDFSWRDRDEIIRYLFETYGADHVALLGAFSTFQQSALTRELGKVFGLPKAEIDQLVHNPYATYAEDSYQKLIAGYSQLIKDFPNHLSIHAGGVLISEAPLCRYTALELPPKGFATTQIDMHVAENIGLYKLDILSQRGLGHIRDCIQLVRENKGIAIDIHAVSQFKNDKRLAAKLREAESIGCFYIESPGMRQLLKKLRCDNYITLVAASSIIRPGVAQSGMMRQYVYNFHHQDEVTYLHPKMEALLKETFGIMVYQEDVIKVAHQFAGLDRGQADILRRAMSGKYRGDKEMQAIKTRFFGNCKAAGYPDAVSNEVWRQIASFAGFSFSKAHSASFAIESYQSLYLKTYFPMEFMVGVINNFGGFYNTAVYFMELKRTGAHIHAPCVNNSRQLTTLRDKEVYVGFIHIQGLEDTLILRIENERHQYGSFINLYDFIERTGAGIEQLNILIRIGALRFTGKSKKELLWEANFLQRRRPQKIPLAAGSLFEEQPETLTLPELQHHPLDDAMDELELLGFALGNPFDYVDDDIRKYPLATRLEGNTGDTITLLGYLVTKKDIYTRQNDRMFFGTFIDAAGNWLDTVHFPAIARRYPLSGEGFYRITGTVMEEFGTYSLNVTHMEKAGIRNRR